MSDKDITQLMLQSLSRIEAKLDLTTERLAILETKAVEQEKINKKVDELVAAKDKGLGVKAVIGWIFTTAVAIGGYFK